MRINKKLTGDRIRTRRTDIGWTLQKLSDKVGITKQQLSKIETGGSGTTSAVLREIARALGMKEPWPLENGENVPPSEYLTEQERIQIELLRKIPISFRDSVISLLQSALEMLSNNENLSGEEQMLVKCYREAEGVSKYRILHTAMQENTATQETAAIQRAIDLYEREKKPLAPPIENNVNSGGTRKLVVLNGKSKGQSLEIPPGANELIIGLEDGCDLQLIDDCIERPFVVNEINGDVAIGPITGGRFTVRNTVMGNQIIDNYWLLAGGDKVLIGKTFLVYVIEP